MPTERPWRPGSASKATTLVQRVDHRGASYPVVADPNTCGTISCTYYFGRSATKDIASGSVLVAACGVLGRIHAAVAAACLVQAGAIVYQASRARNRSGYCLKIKYPRFGQPRVLVPQIYSGGYCR